MVATNGTSSSYVVRGVNSDTMVAVDGFRLVLVLVLEVFASDTAQVSCTVLGITWLYYS